MLCYPVTILAVVKTMSPCWAKDCPRAELLADGSDLLKLARSQCSSIDLLEGRKKAGEEQSEKTPFVPAC